MATTEPDADVRFETRGALGLVTLDRPRALNALTLPMIQLMRARLDAWAGDAAVTRVAITAAPGRAFCAGGDVRAIYEAGRAGRREALFAIWQGEYGLVAALARYPKPLVSLIAGLVMGGGVGVSVHGPYRVAGEGYSFAMPEVGIGFVPDVGMTRVLARLPSRAGSYLALTGTRIGPGDALALGLATHHARAEAFPAMLDGLAAGGAVADVLAAHAAPPPPPGPLTRAAALVEACFAPEDVSEILARLDAAGAGDGPDAGFAAEAAGLIRTRSPTSLVLAREQMRRGADLGVAEAILTEYRLVTRIMRGHDFFEGVRAAVVDKDGRPAWCPARLEDVDRAAVLAAFGPSEAPEPDFG